ncbi:MAG TPA: S46 family peptidase [Blastocatellia bacterium]|nr:S46 family peptidase [Blastocatellia bacterium]
MNFRRSIRNAVVVFAAAASAIPCASVARADEGMWTFNKPPRTAVRKKYGLDLSDAWLKKVQMSAVRFNSGGSGAFISSDGLVLTNHHIASDVLGKISTPDKDYFKTGFYAKTRAEEVKAPDLELNVLVSIEDVTARVEAAVAGAKPDEVSARRRAAFAAIEKESLDATGLRSDVVTLFRGAQYNLYRYKKYTDVRLVFAPEFDVAFFGGDPDNFNYPRFDLDMAIFRAYENDQPARVENFLKWSERGTREGDLVFVAGNPGATSRLNTVRHLQFLKDVQYPFNLRRLEAMRAALLAYAATGAEAERQVHDDIFGVNNSLKVTKGEFAGLNDQAFLRRKGATEAELRKAAASKSDSGNPWDSIGAARTALMSYYIRLRLLEGGVAFNSTLFDKARTLVRIADEDGKPNGERLREYTESSRASLELGLYSPAPIYPGLEKATLTASLEFLKSELGADSPFVATVLKGKTPAVRAAELVDGTKVGTVAFRKELAAGGKPAIDASTDPMIVLAREVDAESRALRKRYENEVVAVEETAYGEIARAIYAIQGDRMYPDATFTLRLAYGTVRGYVAEGRRVSPYTTFGGMYRRAADARNADPYHLPGRWLERKSAVRMTVPVNFVSTADTIGGNSGSPLVDRNAELVGLNFDRNSYGLVRNFMYDETRARNVAVDSRGMLEALRTIYHADELVAELTR